MKDIEKEFKETADKINAKIREATAALKEANQLADQAGMAGLIYTQYTYDYVSYNNSYLNENQIRDKCDKLEKMCELIKVSEFEEELEKSGWSPSSSHC